MNGVIKGDLTVKNASIEEITILQKLIDGYSEFKSQNQGKAYSFQVANEIDSLTYTNFAQKLFFDILSDNVSEIIEKVDLKAIYNKVYQERRSTLTNDMFIVSHGLNLEIGDAYEKIAGEIGSKFEAHGIAKREQLANLLNLLTDGID